MRIICLYAIMLIIFIGAVTSFAHPGGTDSDGGHNSDDGYHYHHGYPAHDHEDGECPYDFDDKTGLNSGAPSTSPDYNDFDYDDYYDDHDGDAVETTQSYTEEMQETTTPKDSPIPGALGLLYVLLTIVFIIVCVFKPPIP